MTPDTTAQPAPCSSPALLDVYEQLPFSPERGEGVVLVDGRGRRYLDFYGGHAVALLGYGHTGLLDALDRQARTLFFQSNVVPLAVRDQAAERLVGFAPAGLDRAFFVNSGAEANENALRIALVATGRERIVAVEGAFHGRTAAAAAVTAGSERWYGFLQRPFATTFVPFDDVGALRAAVRDDVAAVIVEPVQGVAGARACAPEFLTAARDVTAQRGALLIFDEVQCGMGRTGHPFAAQAYGVTPDLLTVAKGLAGGFPAGAVLTRSPIGAVLRRGALGTTFGGGPLAAALVVAVIDAIEAEGLLENVRRLSTRLRAESVVGPVEAVQGMGFLLGLRTSAPAREVLAELRARGILAGASADPHVVRLLPPLVLKDEHVDRLVAALGEIRA
jgi:acetylornithine/succinyldiaminopimelate/putrescine aminotransferase